ncbi:hypothetical protein BJX99DRAFT_242580 [Aspergillus californicus]
MQLSFNCLDPQPYLTHTPAPVTPSLLHPNELGNTGHESFYQTRMDMSHMTTHSLDPRPYLTNMPALVTPNLSGPRQPETSDSLNIQTDPSWENMVFDDLDPRPYLTYIPVAQPAGPDEQQAYVSLEQQIEGSYAQQVEPNRYPNVAEWREQLRNQMAYRINELDVPYQLGPNLLNRLGLRQNYENTKSSSGSLQIVVYSDSIGKDKGSQSSVIS